MKSFKNLIPRRRPAGAMVAPDTGAPAAPSAPRPQQVAAGGMTEASLPPPDARDLDRARSGRDTLPRPEAPVRRPDRSTMEDSFAPAHFAAPPAAKTRPPSDPILPDPVLPAPGGKPAPAAIWDLEQDTAPQPRRAQTVAATLPPTTPPATPPISPPVSPPISPSAAPAPRPTDSARMRTRLLGFGAPPQADAFATETANAGDTRFPIGWLVLVDGPGRGASFTLTSGLSTIGRGPDQAVRLDFGDTAISRASHAAVAYDPEDRRVLVGHGGRSNIVRLNGEPLLSREELRQGDEIRIGKTTLRFVAFCGPDFDWDEGADPAGAGPDA